MYSGNGKDITHQSIKSLINFYLSSTLKIRLLIKYPALMLIIFN